MKDQIGTESEYQEYPNMLTVILKNIRHKDGKLCNH